MKNPKLLLSLLGLLAAASAGAANVTKSDPSPNSYDPITFAPLAGGVGYTWTVVMGADDTADMEGSVGAWSWDEDGFRQTAKGWTHTSNWVALKLTKASKVTFRLSRKENVPVDGGGVAGNILYPAFTLYRNWDGDGGDDHTYNNKGNVVWAEDLVYVTHVENVNGATSSELTLELPAGFYSLAIGGNSPSTNREPDQGYGFEISSKSLPTSEILVRNAPGLVSAGTATVSGNVSFPEKAKRIHLIRGKQRKMVRLSDGKWSTVVDGLEPGRNVIWLKLESNDGTMVDRKRVVIERSKPTLSPRGGTGSN